MKNHLFRSIVLSVGMLLAGSSLAFAQGPGMPPPGGPGGPEGPGPDGSGGPGPVMPIGGPGPVISAPGSPAGIGQNNVPPPPNPQINNGPAPVPGSNVYNPGPPPVAPPPLAGPGPSVLAPLVVNVPLSSPNWENSGTTTVIACGYDAQGVWRTIPLRVSYTYNGAQYMVTVNSAWNPWTDCWNYGVDEPAFSTDYFLNGNTYNYYTNLSTGTFYFNL